MEFAERAVIASQRAFMADVTKPTVYVETSVVSYLTARPLSDPIVAGQMAATREWWADAPAQFDLYTSALVIAEAAAGDAKAAAERLTALATLPQVPLTDEARQFFTGRNQLAVGDLPLANLAE